MKIFLLFLICACQGYKFQDASNPFLENQIKSIAVVNFYNFTNISHLSAPFAKEMTFMLSGFSDLRIVNDYRKADAVLVGILNSPEERVATRMRETELEAKAILSDRIGNNRNNFLLPTQTRLNISLNLMLIKGYNKSDIETLKSQGKLIDPRVVFEESLPLTRTFTREVLAGDANNFTQTRVLGAERNAIADMAEQAAVTFREMILYDF